jgi:hypothetical protein
VIAIAVAITLRVAVTTLRRGRAGLGPAPCSVAGAITGCGGGGAAGGAITGTPGGVGELGGTIPGRGTGGVGGAIGGRRGGGAPGTCCLAGARDAAGASHPGSVAGILGRCAGGRGSDGDSGAPSARCADGTGTTGASGAGHTIDASDMSFSEFMDGSAYCTAHASSASIVAIPRIAPDLRRGSLLRAASVSAYRVSGFWPESGRASEIRPKPGRRRVPG